MKTPRLLKKHGLNIVWQKTVPYIVQFLIQQDQQFNDNLSLSNHSFI